MKAKKTTGHKPFRSLDASQDNVLLLHSLSPIELAAFNHRFTRFTYNLDGVPLEIEGHVARDLFFSARKHVDVLRKILYHAQIKQLRRPPPTRKFLNTHIRDMNLPKRLYNILWKAECINMADVAYLGRLGLFRLKGLGHDSLDLLTDLFRKNGCGELFS